jgi:hypothetical protein
MLVFSAVCSVHTRCYIWATNFKWIFCVHYCALAFVDINFGTSTVRQNTHRHRHQMSSMRLFGDQAPKGFIQYQKLKQLKQPRPFSSSSSSKVCSILENENDVNVASELLVTVPLYC